jgi:hypothetical protein
MTPVRRRQASGTGVEASYDKKSLGTPVLLQGQQRRGPDSNRRIKVLQTSPLPLGYRAIMNEELKMQNAK